MNRLSSSQRALLQPCIPALLSSRTSLFARLFLAALKRVAVGHLVLLRPDGEETIYGDPHEAPGARLMLLDWRACEAILRAGDIGFAEAYRAGWVDTPDLGAVLRVALDNEAALSGAIHGAWLSRRWYQLRHLLRRNTRGGSRRNIHAHYDLGNPFYALWLDETWSYSAAHFDGDSDRPLAEAQEAKYAHICDVLRLKPGMHVLEIGCGWGGFALHAARRGVNVYGITISAAQLAKAQARIAQAGCTDRVKLELRDYRDLEGTYDAIVSIEMFEAVGEAYWPTFFDQISRRLRPGGQAVVQSITIDDARFNAYRSSSDFIREYIFPGGMLPSPERFAQAAGRSGFSSRKVLDFGRDYAETLRRWREQFEAQMGAILALGFDDAFIRMWRLYLCYCEVGFDAGRTDVMQFLLARRN
ncbi:SAM-dependent methyltransferase [Cupriavidus numazuensis]|uniref:Tuberculostearic acid methyltransferase UfaA1 n=1 Tax=Cupriavidus numazuensis TaxID=221992 RepID=A0ABM8TW82_9BURK|nr:cyclopropane-fatty-acyl-phospholipid synthase family protein [Cupriavidus numazuensis]CAG2160994.1 Tuberculostearic acid methyltransferase UfaA1 [Cupriavidus numazuensis]